MIALAALGSGLFAAFAVAGATGRMPTLRRTGRPQVRGGGGVRDLVRRSGVDLRPAQVLGMSAGAVVVVAVVITAATPVDLLAVVPAGIAGAAPFVWLRRRATTRRQAIRQAWPDALAQISGSVRAGRPLSHALIDVSLTGPPAMAEVMAGLAARIQTVGFPAALQAVRRAVADPVTDRVIEVLVLAQAEGGRIVLDIIDDLGDTVAAEVAAADEVETLALEGKLNARVVFALPWLVLVFLTARTGPFQDFYTSAGGGLVIAIGAVLSLVGIALVSRLSTADPEPRVLVAEEEA